MKILHMLNELKPGNSINSYLALTTSECSKIYSNDFLSFKSTFHASSKEQLLMCHIIILELWLPSKDQTDWL